MLSFGLSKEERNSAIAQGRRHALGSEVDAQLMLDATGWFCGCGCYGKVEVRLKVSLSQLQCNRWRVVRPAVFFHLSVFIRRRYPINLLLIGAWHTCVAPHMLCNALVELFPTSSSGQKLPLPTTQLLPKLSSWVDELGCCRTSSSASNS